MPRIELDPEEVRRLVPLAIDMIRDDLNRPEFQRGVTAQVVAEEDPWQLVAVQTFIGRWFARSLAESANMESERMRAFLAEWEATYVSESDDVWTPDRVLTELQDAILEQWKSV